MNKKLIISIIILLIIFIIASIIVFKYKSASKEKEIDPIMDMNEQYIKNQILISFKEDTPSSKITKIIARTKATYTESDGLYVLTFTKPFNSRQELTKYCTELKSSNPAIENCEANEIIILDDCTNGPC